ncbi:hypothetical protein PUNSTDRAFT_154784 [Punctularia strigosozonata HHB-11173 SS5]|uniref:uncharacterized protein n=1 Tax=Punctularia strigosozonata (strain HHB-11173) TaxID=741275 RepID=UPI00044181C8|nr:uncharacterized protein PUNSTDRAFT_154784 [Punctularia strigosozonata HHB-11173 SS5]EIN08692.1 hypothetical protein PUNSTDRAFT_154784 [Punctularia strigosozonata HHB-11173 SS5]
MLALAVAASFIASVAAHATFQEIWINGVDFGSTCVRLPQSNSPVTDVTSTAIACNANPSSSNGVCSVMPGDQVTVEMHQQPGDRSCANEAIGGDHFGPMQVYLAKVDDATTAVGSDANWFKIDEMGMPSDSPDYWATEVLNDNCGHYTVTIPSDIAPGNYLLKAEVIALHVASSPGGAQFYTSCYQINVGGSGTASPPTVKFPGAYSASDPGILINIYQSLTAYTIPGPTPHATQSPAVANTPWPTTATWNTALQPSTVPTVMPSGAGGAPAPTSKSASSSSSASHSSAPASSTPAQTSSAPVSSGTGTPAAKYGQCGGIGWSGSTACQSGSTCTVVNSYYSQCL